MRRPYHMPCFWRLCSGMFSLSDSAKKVSPPAVSASPQEQLSNKCAEAVSSSACSSSSCSRRLFRHSYCDHDSGQYHESYRPINTMSTVVIFSIRIHLGSSLSTRLQRRQSSNQPHCHDDEIDEGRQGCRPTQATPFPRRPRR